MDQDFKDIFNDVKRQSLSENERVSMRNALLAHMAEYPAKAPFSVRFADAVSSGIDAFGRQSYTRLRFMPSALALVLVIGIGTAYAAEGALPGDLLYGMKVSVNESIRGALAVSDESRASWQTERIERRLMEAEMLVAKDRLTPIAQASIEAHIDSSAAAFDRNVQKLAVADNDAAVAAAQSDLEASLIGHAEVLVALSSTAKSADDSAAAPIIRSVIAKAEAAQTARAHSEATIAAKRDAKQVRSAAIEKKNEAKIAVENVKAKASSVLAATTSIGEVAKETAAAADITIQAAEQELENGDYSRAFSVFQEAIRTAKTIEVHIDASERLKTDLRIFTRAPAQEAGADAALMMSAQPGQE